MGGSIPQPLTKLMQDDARFSVIKAFLLLIG